jgi:hypothetical protein
MTSPADKVFDRITFDLEHGLLPEGFDISKLPEPTRSRLRQALDKAKDAVGKLRRVADKLGRYSKLAKASGAVGFALWAAQQWWDGYSGFKSKQKAQKALDDLEDEFAAKMAEVKARYAEPINPSDPNSPREVPAALRDEYLATLDLVESIFDLRRQALNAAMQKIQSDLSDNWLVWIGDMWVANVSPMFRADPVSRAVTLPHDASLGGYLDQSVAFAADDVLYSIAPEMIGIVAAQTKNGFEIAHKVWSNPASSEVQRAVSLRVMRCETVARNLKTPCDMDAVDAVADELWLTTFHRSEHGAVRAECVLASYRNRRPEGIRVLEAGLKDVDGRVRVLALEGVGALANLAGDVKVNGIDPMKLLLGAVKSDDRWTRLGALAGLALINGEDDKIAEVAQAAALRDAEDDIIVMFALAQAVDRTDAKKGVALVQRILGAPALSPGLASYAFAQLSHLDPAAAHVQLVAAATAEGPLAVGARNFTAARAVLCCDPETKADLVPAASDFDVT